VVKAFLPHTPQESLTDRIGSGSVIRRLEHFYATCRCHSHKTGFELAIVITEQILRCLPIRGGFPKLLRHPDISRGLGDSDMDHPAGLELDDEKSKERAKEEIAHLQEITGPDIFGMGVQKRAPLLTFWLGTRTDLIYF